MNSLFLNEEQRGTVVFHLIPSIKYKTRQTIAFALIIGGFITQIIMNEATWGLLVVFIGNLFLLVKGYSNKIDYGKFTPDANWEKVDDERLDDVIRMNKKMKKWDISFIDITSGAGFVTLLFVLVAFFILFLYGYENNIEAYKIISLNFLVLTLPYWFTGFRKILTTPALVNKVKAYKFLDKKVQINENEVNTNYYMLLKGNEQKVPTDIKVKFDFKDQPKSVLGLYGQVATNEVNGATYPYFYTVFVAKKDSGLQTMFDKIEPPFFIVKEYTKQTDVEVLVLRQKTTKNSGYHTKPTTMADILEYSLKEGKKEIYKLK